MAVSTLSSPGVEVRELDNSLRVTASNGTTIYIPGFAAQGPTEEVNPIGTMDDFESIYGTPTTIAECYFYYTVAAVIENGGTGANVLVYRLPYGEGDGDNTSGDFTALAYPVYPIHHTISWYPMGSYYAEDANARIFAKPLKDTVTIAESVQVVTTGDTVKIAGITAEKAVSTDTYAVISDGILYVATILKYNTATTFSTFTKDSEAASTSTDFAPSTTDNNDFVTYVVGAPTTHQLDLAEYYSLVSGEHFDTDDWAETASISKDVIELSDAGFIIVNTSRNIIDKSYQGYYLGMSDNIFNNPDDTLYKDTSNYKAVSDVKFVNDTTSTVSANYQKLNHDRLGFYLDENYSGSISRILQTELTKFNTSGETYDDTLNIALFRLTKSTSNTNVLSLNYSISESYNASLGKSRLQSVGTSTATKSYFIENEVANSNFLSVLVNPNIAKNIYIDTDNVLHGKVRVYNEKLKNGINESIKAYAVDTSKTASENYHNVISLDTVLRRAGINANDLTGLANKLELNDAIYGFGRFTGKDIEKDSKIIGNVPAKVKRALKFVSNDEIYPDLDIVLEAGLGTIYAYATALKDSETGNIFIDTKHYIGVEDLRTGRPSISGAAEEMKQSYMAVQNAFLSFANSFQNGGRGDTFYIADVLRGILIKGKNTKVTQLFGSTLKNSVYTDTSANNKTNHSWATSIYHPINHLLDSFTTSYASVYAQYFKVNDEFSGENIWIPSCGYVAALMARSDSQYGPWYAAAGYNRGIIPGVLDCAVNPDQGQRDDLYKICVNSIPKIGNIGITIWGIRTMSKKASCFDQNTCRRTFLHMEKTIKRYLRYYVFEPNNSYTQLAIFNDLDPYLENIKNRGGIYSYTLICDDSVNTDEIVNDGEMVARVEAAPTRTAEKIVLEMVANRKNSTIATL